LTELFKKLKGGCFLGHIVEQKAPYRMLTVRWN